MFTSACSTTIIVRPRARSEPKRSGASSDVRRPRQAITPKHSERERRAEQAELFADDGEDEVVVRLGEVVELLHAGHQAAAEAGRRTRRRSATGRPESRRRAARPTDRGTRQAPAPVRPSPSRAAWRSGRAAWRRRRDSDSSGRREHHRRHDERQSTAAVPKSGCETIRPASPHGDEADRHQRVARLRSRGACAARAARPRR